jgi:hypothetical protein
MKKATAWRVSDVPVSRNGDWCSVMSDIVCLCFAMVVMLHAERQLFWMCTPFHIWLLWGTPIARLHMAGVFG